MLFLGKILNKKDENNKNNLKYSSIFEDEITLEIDGHSKTGKLQELILDILQKDDIADADAFVEIIKQFISKEPLAIKNEKFDKKNINLTNFED
jgi:small-conductance mechanosensitive channel